MTSGTWKALGAWLGGGFLSALFPPVCAACNALGREPFCAICSQGLLPASPLEIAGAEASVACFAYGGPIAQAIQRLKYERRGDLARSLGTLLKVPFTRLGSVDGIVPMPLSPARLLARGFNQSVELARPLGRIEPRLLTRLDRPAQVGLPRSARLTNPIGSFLCPSSPKVRGRTLVLIDDVITTGATAREAIRALQRAGARRVILLALASSDDRSTP